MISKIQNLIEIAFNDFEIIKRTFAHKEVNFTKKSFNDYELMIDFDMNKLTIQTLVLIEKEDLNFIIDTFINYNYLLSGEELILRSIKSHYNQESKICKSRKDLNIQFTGGNLVRLTEAEYWEGFTNFKLLYETELRNIFKVMLTSKIQSNLYSSQKLSILINSAEGLLRTFEKEFLKRVITKNKAVKLKQKISNNTHDFLENSMEDLEISNEQKEFLQKQVNDKLIVLGDFSLNQILESLKNHDEYSKSYSEPIFSRLKDFNKNIKYVRNYYAHLTSFGEEGFKIDKNEVVLYRYVLSDLIRIAIIKLIGLNCDMTHVNLLAYSTIKYIFDLFTS